MTSAAKKIRRTLLIWHRRIGAVIALFLLLLAVTGVLLNHSSDLRLADKSIGYSSWWLNFYNIERPDIVSYRLFAHRDVEGRGPVSWISHLGGNYVYLNGEEVAYCPAPFGGAAAITEMIVVICDQLLLLVTPTGDVIERVDSALGLPANLQSITSRDNRLFLAAADRWYLAELIQPRFKQVDPSELGLAGGQPARALPDEIEERLLAEFVGDEINLERLLLDLHSGRLAGISGVVWMDLVAFFLVWVAGSGLWVWLTRPSVGWLRRK